MRVDVLHGGFAVDVREIHTVGVVVVVVVLPRTVGRRRREQLRGTGFIPVLRRDAVGILGCRAEAAGVRH